jgi:hypothetical protein
MRLQQAVAVVEAQHKMDTLWSFLKVGGGNKGCSLTKVAKEGDDVKIRLQAVESHQSLREGNYEVQTKSVLTFHPLNSFSGAPDHQDHSVPVDLQAGALPSACCPVCKGNQCPVLHEAFRRLRPGVPLRALHGGMKQARRMAVFYEFCEVRPARGMCGSSSSLNS